MNEHHDNTQPEQSQPQKGSKTRYYFLGGCGFIVIIAITITLLLFSCVKKTAQAAKHKFDDLRYNSVLYATEKIINANPDLEIISKDAKANFIIYKNNLTGETFTVNEDDIKQGRINIIDLKDNDESAHESKDETILPDGNNTPIPSTVVIYPGIRARSLFHTIIDGHPYGILEQVTADSIETVMATLEDELKHAGYIILDKNIADNHGAIVSDNPDFHKSLSINVSSENNSTKIIINYSYI